jgi:hypothetical protein
VLLSIALAVFRFADRLRVGLPFLISHVLWLLHEPNADPE